MPKLQMLIWSKLMSPLESPALKIIRQVRRDIAHIPNLPYREYIAIIRTLDILIEELSNVQSLPRPSALPTPPR
jgi:hypothetical protein